MSELTIRTDSAACERRVGIWCVRRSNLAFESQHLLHAVEGAGIKNWVSLSEGQQGTLGWLTTNERKVRTLSNRTAHVRVLTPMLA